MFEYVKKGFRRIKKEIGKLNFSGASMRYILAYALFVALICILYVAGWLADWYKHAKADLQELRAFLSVLTSSAWIAAMAFVAKAFVDRNKDGVPDFLDEKKGDGKNDK